MSIAWMTRVWESPDPRRATHRLLLLALADNANDEGVCWPSVGTLARKVADDRRNVMRKLALLEEQGFIDRDRRAGRTTVYRLRMPSGTGRGDSTTTGVTPTTGVSTTTGKGVSSEPRGGDSGTTGGVAVEPPEPSITISNPNNTNARARVREAELRSDGADGGGVFGNNGGAEKGAGTGAEPGLKAALVERGVSEGAAATLVREFGRERVQRQLYHLSVLDTSGRSPRNAGAWLVEAIRGDFQLPTAGGPAGPAPGDGLFTQPEAIAWCEKHGITLSPRHPITKYFEPVGGGMLRLITP